MHIARSTSLLSGLKMQLNTITLIIQLREKHRRIYVLAASNSASFSIDAEAFSRLACSLRCCFLLSFFSPYSSCYCSGSTDFNGL